MTTDTHNGFFARNSSFSEPKYIYSGRGWLDRDNLPPGDRRFLASMGPFSIGGFVIQSIAPNPVVPGSTVSIEVSTTTHKGSAFTFQLIELLGRTRSEDEFDMVSQSPMTVQLKTPSALPSGLYRIRVSDGTHTKMKSLLLLR
jgi:hypothetical protein